MLETRVFTQLVIAAAILAVAIGGTWHYARQDLHVCIVDDSLQPIATLLEDNKKLVDELKTDGYADSESTILGSYLARIRKDGVPKNSAMKQLIDRLANNNTVIVALLSRYVTHAPTPSFKAAADQFRDYADSFRDRWQSLFEIFMAEFFGTPSLRIRAR